MITDYEIYEWKIEYLGIFFFEATGKWIPLDQGKVGTKKKLHEWV